MCSEQSSASVSSIAKVTILLRYFKNESLRRRMWNIRSRFTADHLVHMCQAKTFPSTNNQQAGKEKVKKQKVSHLSDSPKRVEKKPEMKEINKKRSANSRRESYCLQRWGKAHFSTSMKLGPFNPRQHSLARYLFSAHQSLSLSFLLVFAFNSFNSLCFRRNKLCFSISPNRHRNSSRRKNFTIQWKSFNFVEKNHLISLRPFVPGLKPMFLVTVWLTFYWSLLFVFFHLLDLSCGDDDGGDFGGKKGKILQPRNSNVRIFPAIWLLILLFFNY